MVGEKGEAHLIEKEKGHDSAGKRFWISLDCLFLLCGLLLPLWSLVYVCWEALVGQRL